LTIRESSGTIAVHGGLKLFYRTWKPEEPLGGMVLVHGMNEHIGRYEHVARFFAGQGYAVYGMDQRGYGQSEGPRCHVDRFEAYIEDLHQFVTGTASEYGSPVMVGHSLGGLIAFRYGLVHPEALQALVISSPGFGAKAKPDPITKALAPILSAVAPRLQLAVPFHPENVCRDPEVARQYGADPLVWKKATPRWFTEFTKAGLACCQGGLCTSMKLPVLFLQAGDDLIVDPEATRAVFEQVPHERKAFKLYAGKYHEIFNDPGKEDVFQDILTWLQQQELIQVV
jgi:lysophospholipase